MGAILPVIGTIGTIASGVSAVSSLANRAGQGESLRQQELLQQRQAVEEKNAIENAINQRQEIAIRAQEADNERRKALKRAVSRQRAEFGASGISSNNGSSEAVLLGLFEDTEQDRLDRERLDNVRLAAIDNKLTQLRRVNTLERTQQQNINKLSDITKTANEISSFGNSIDKIFG